MSRATRACLLAAAAAAVSACGGGAVTRFYTLDPTPPAAPPPYAAAYAGAPVRVDAVHVPASLDRLELVRRTGPNTFQVRDNDHWAGPVGELARRALTQDLQSRLPEGRVIFPDAPKPAGAQGLVVDLLAITPGSDAVTLDASWTLLGPGHAGPLRQRAVRLTTPPALGPSADAAELSALLGKLADAVAADLAAPGAARSAR